MAAFIEFLKQIPAFIWAGLAIVAFLLFGGTGGQQAQVININQPGGGGAAPAENVATAPFDPARPFE